VLTPEIDVFIKLSDRNRLFLLGGLDRNLTETTTAGVIGLHLDLTVKPILRRSLREADWERDRYLWVRVGYQRIGGLDFGKGASAENQAIAEATARQPLPYKVWLVGRVRTDLLRLDGDLSARFRLRLGMEREVVLGGRTVVPYAEAEAVYNSRFSAWNGWRYQAGGVVVLSERWSAELYYARLEDRLSPIDHVHQIGLVLTTYR
jgi:hypothetical protein